MAQRAGPGSRDVGFWTRISILSKTIDLENKDANLERRKNSDSSTRERDQADLHFGLQIPSEGGVNEARSPDTAFHLVRGREYGTLTRATDSRSSHSTAGEAEQPC
ncbi:hypothetical protein H072_4695 [Dactylellina haptotyla CBS 200.50]|uniref:Uncharacterized protein n=1 Tax=Dactylellina haptotyla (strain CBS 200.50) TaxID=1284197 RepID=S8AES5_DACHA|nr:hypothetical protein H072_4695 [Dactylellina haptotyla CBS 200.50]